MSFNEPPAGGRGRGRGGRGRGYANRNGGRGNHQTRNKDSGGRGGSRGQITTHIHTRDFLSMHRSCRAAAYKVHKLGCNCDKLRSVQSSNVKFVGRDDDEGDGEEEPPRTFEELEARRNQGLLVLPDFKHVRHVYLCQNDNVLLDDNGEDEPRCGLENKLKEELFSERRQDNDGDDKGSSFKVSCAGCLLKDEPNGFACISSTNYNLIMTQVRDAARQAQQVKIANGDKLHPDHAHHCIVLPHSALARIHRSKTRSQSQQARDEVLELMQHQQDVPITPETTVEVELGHHLGSALDLTRTTANKDEEESYWFLMVYDDTQTKTPHWTLDLPGGKRHLGETAIKAAMRETQEETSLAWDPHWIQGQLKGKGKSQLVNLYFLLKPPAP
jgi:hypothetical protein